MDRWGIGLALWLVTALFAVTMALAPASAHPGHADAGFRIAAHNRGDAGMPGIKAASSISPTALRTASLVKTASVVGALSSQDDGCHGACCRGMGCYGMGCCPACIIGQSPTFALYGVAAAGIPAPARALTSIEPGSLLEPPNTIV